MQDHLFLWWPGRKCYTLAGKFWLIYHIHQILQLWFPFILVFTKFSMEKFSIPWKTSKDTWKSSLLKKIKSFGRWNYEVAWKMAESSGTKWWTLFNKVIGENEKCLLFLLKNWTNILANPIQDFVERSQWRHKQTERHPVFMNSQNVLTTPNHLYFIYFLPLLEYILSFTFMSLISIFSHQLEELFSISYKAGIVVVNTLTFVWESPYFFFISEG